MEQIGVAARGASRVLATVPHEHRNAVLAAIAARLASAHDAVLAANAQDLAAAKASGLEASTYKRLILDAPKLDSLIQGLKDLSSLPDPLGTRTLHRELTDGLVLERVACPLGVLCIIFEARPEAVIQIASLAIKSGNAVILKGGKEAVHSNAALVALVRDAIADVAAAVGSSDGTVPLDAVQLVSTREEVAGLLKLDEHIDLVIPRGSKQLVKDVKAATRIPVLGHADGVCAVYLDAAADVTKAVPLVVDSKTQYPAACNAAETLLVHSSAVETLLPPVAAALLSAGVSLHCDEATLPVVSAAAAALGGDAAARVCLASQSDWDTEWGSLTIGVAAVPSTAAAIAWINAHGSHHTDAIITEDAAAAAAFLAGVDSAGVYHNASTRFADGFRYGFGAEVGISTNRLHARGPVGLEGLLTYKYKLRGQGQTVSQFSGGAGEVVVGGQSLPPLAFTHKSLPL